MQLGVVIVAGGKGLRFGGETPKQFLDLAGKPVLAHSIAVFENHSSINKIVVVGPDDWLYFIDEEIVDRFGFDKVQRIVGGGAERQDSVLAGLNALDDATGPVLIHDGARPLVTAAIIDRIIAGLSTNNGVIPAIPVTDTIKEIENDRVQQTLQRERLRAIQTPQGFIIENLKPLLLQSKNEKFAATDEAMVLEKNGESVAVVDGHSTNIKITDEHDLKIAELILRDRDL
ncbi:MAG: 2-C-methyl-D-erythritol 4-phosphate cytidylyltransferase [Calditrichaeota bacterium]|nr:MAG: 2-C-methyl-D-erythritol 4-phosphate cytidylyltransferase [Calditrichota bacterium]